MKNNNDKIYFIVPTSCKIIFFNILFSLGISLINGYIYFSIKNDIARAILLTIISFINLFRLGEYIFTKQTLGAIQFDFIHKGKDGLKYFVQFVILFIVINIIVYLLT